MFKNICLGAILALCGASIDAASAIPLTSQSPLPTKSKHGPNSYDVEISFTTEAKIRMKGMGKMVYVEALYSGVPKDPQSIGMEDYGTVTLGTDRIVVHPVDQVVHMHSLEFSKAKLAEITGSSPDVSLGVESGESYEPKPNDHWLICSQYQGTIAETKKLRPKIYCKFDPSGKGF